MNRFHFVAFTIPYLLVPGCGNEPASLPSVFHDPGVIDFVFPDESTILLSTSEGRFRVGKILASTDDSASWSAVAEENFFEMAIGSGGSIWGTYSYEFDRDATPPGFTLPPGIGVSTDGGRSFTRFDITDYSYGYPGLIQLDDADPLLLASGDGLYRITLPPDGTDAAVESFNPPVPTEFISESVTDAVMCRGALHASVIGIDWRTGKTHLRIWRLDEGQVEWQQQFEIVTFDRPLYFVFACGLGADLWVTSDDGLVMHFDEEEQRWKQLVELDQFLPNFRYSASSAAVAGALFVDAETLVSSGESPL